MRDDVYRLAQGLLLKGINYVYRTKRTLLEHLAANGPGVSSSGTVLGVENFETPQTPGRDEEGDMAVEKLKKNESFKAAGDLRSMLPNIRIVCGDNTNEMETESKGPTPPASPSTPPKGGAIAQGKDRKGKDGREVKARKPKKPVLMDCKPMPGSRKRKNDTVKTPVQLSNPNTKKARKFYVRSNRKPAASLGGPKDFKDFKPPLCSSESKFNFPTVKLLQA